MPGRFAKTGFTSARAFKKVLLSQLSCQIRQSSPAKPDVCRLGIYLWTIWIDSNYLVVTVNAASQKVWTTISHFCYKDRSFHESPEKAGVEGWLYSEQQQNLCQFKPDTATVYSQWVAVHTYSWVPPRPPASSNAFSSSTGWTSPATFRCQGLSWIVRVEYQPINCNFHAAFILTMSSWCSSNLTEHAAAVILSFIPSSQLDMKQLSGV